MSFSSVTTLSGDRKPRTLPRRELDPVELRVLGCLIEKQMSTPEYYPLTLNALVAAANQKSNRGPVMELNESELQRALDRLQDEKLVWKVLGGRAVRWDHNLDTTWQLERSTKAIVALLFLRGPQTSGELRGRSDRLHQFDSVSEVEETLQRMSHEPALVKELARRPGQKESRWGHVLGGAIIEPEEPAVASHGGASASGEPMSVRVARLEEQVATLTAELKALKETLGA
jgi:uncharacterized protein YceH (UPF0502 family)